MFPTYMLPTVFATFFFDGRWRWLLANSAKKNSNKTNNNNNISKFCYHPTISDVCLFLVGALCETVCPVRVWVPCLHAGQTQHLEHIPSWKLIWIIVLTKVFRPAFQKIQEMLYSIHTRIKFVSWCQPIFYATMFRIILLWVVFFVWIKIIDINPNKLSHANCAARFVWNFWQFVS